MSDPFLTNPPETGVRTSGGQLIIPAALPVLNATAPREMQQLLEWESLRGPLSCELQLQCQYQPAFTQGFPDTSIASSEPAGAYYDEVSVWNLGQSALIAKLELGSGPVPRTIYADMRSGRWALGSQQRVRVSVGRWIGAFPFAGTQVSVQAAVAAASSTDADPLTYTAAIQIPVAGTRSITTPPGACWFDAQIGADDPTVGAQVLITDSVTTWYRDSTPAAPVIYPPASPWPIGQLTTLDVINRGAAAANVRLVFWVR